MTFKAVLIAAILVVGSAAFAQTGAKTGQTKTIKRSATKRLTSEQRVEKLAKAVNLTADQKQKVLAVFAAGKTKKKTIFEDKKMDLDAKRLAFVKLQQEDDIKLKAILTKEQLKKLEAMRKQRAGG